MSDKGGVHDIPREEWPEPQPLSVDGPVPPFPRASAFPPSLAWLRDYVGALATAYQVPVDLPAMLVLAVAAVAVARKLEVEPCAGWREPLALWVLVLLRSGERKSAVFAALIAVIYEWQRERAEAMRSEIARHANSVEIVKRKLANAQRNAAQPSEQSLAAASAASELADELAELEANAPHAPSLIVTDATTEAIATVLAQNDERALVAAAEADVLDVLLGRYSDGQSNMGVWLAGHAGDAVEVRRRTRGPDSLRRPALCVALAIQPIAVEGLLESKQARGRGLLARYLFATPRSMLGYRELKPPPVPSELSAKWRKRLRSLLDQPVPEAAAMVGLSAAAAELIRAHRAEVEIALRDDGELADRAAWASKLPGAVLRIAGVMHALADGGGLIDEATMRAALAWVRYLVEHEQRAGQVLGADPVAAVAERILRWVRRGGLTQFSRREAYHGVRDATVRRVEDADPALALLVEHGWIRPVPQPPPSPDGGRPPSPRFDVHPAAHNAHNPHTTPRGGGNDGVVGVPGVVGEPAASAQAEEEGVPL